MSETRESAASMPTQRRADPEPTGWVGLIAFAGVIMIMMGVFHAIAGLVALFKDEYYVVGSRDLVVSVDYSAWGWAHLILGIVVCAAGYGLLAGRTWARVVGVVVALASALVNFVFMAAYPFWSLLMVVLSVAVIYAILAHGREMRQSV